MVKRLLLEHFLRVEDGMSNLVGSSAQWREINQRVTQLAFTDGHVLVTGERGAGKLRLALAIVAIRGRAPAIVDTSAASAVGPAAWLEELAASLGELSDESAVVVARLERLEPEVRASLSHLLASRPVPSLATAVSPERAGADKDGLDPAGLFTGPVHIPALRHRLEDIEGLARHFDALHGDGSLIWTAEALEVMEHYLWPGNLKELEGVVKDLTLRLPPVTEVRPDLLPDRLHRGVRRRPLTRLEEAEVDVMLAALAESNGNKDLAAQLVGIHRATLYRKLQNYGLDWASEA